MMMNKNANEQDALYIAWSENQSSLDRIPLKSWLRENPDETDALMLWAEMEPVFRVAELRESYAVSEGRAKEIGQEVLLARRASFVGAEQPIRGLLSLAKERGVGVRELAKRVGIGVTFIAKMQDRLLVPSTIPTLLVERLAEALGATVSQVRAYLEMPPQLATGAMFKASEVPTVGKQQDFREALQGCFDMTEAEKGFWREAE